MGKPLMAKLSLDLTKSIFPMGVSKQSPTLLTITTDSLLMSHTKVSHIIQKLSLTTQHQPTNQLQHINQLRYTNQLQHTNQLQYTNLPLYIMHEQSTLESSEVANLMIDRHNSMKDTC